VAGIVGLLLKQVSHIYFKGRLAICSFLLYRIEN